MKKNNLPHHKRSGFSVPSNYFEELENELLDLVAAGEEKEGLISKKMPSGFKVPQGYFDQIEENLLKEIKPEPKVIPLFRRELLSYAASIAVILFVFYGSYLITSPTSGNDWDSLEISALESYIDENYIDFSTSELSGFLYEDGGVIEESEFTEVNAEAMLEYLDENVDDPSFIID